MTFDPNKAAAAVGGPARDWRDLFGPALVGALAGVLLYVISEHWKPEAPTWYYFVIVISAAFVLTWSRATAVSSILFSTGLAIAAALPLHFMFETSGGWSDDSSFPHLAIWGALTAPYFCYVATAFFRAILGKGTSGFSYTRLFDNIIRIPLLLFLSMLFTGIIFGLYGLWTALFEVIEIDFFLELMDEPWFLLPVAGSVGGLSVALMRGWDGFVSMWKNLALLLCRLAVPIIALFSLAFLLVLPFTGLEKLWDTASATGLTGFIAITLLVFANGVRQDGLNFPPNWLQISTYSTILTAPFYVAISAYALYLRVDQYGFTPPRYMGAVLMVVLVFYALGSVLALLMRAIALRSKGFWLGLLSPLNVITAVGLGFVLISLHTPFNDPLRMSVKSQINRLTSGDVTIEEFDVAHFYFDLGQPGQDALEELQETDLGQNEVFLNNLEVARIVYSKYAYERALRAQADFDDVISEKKSIYQIDLPRMRFHNDDIGLNLVKKLAALPEGHPDHTIITTEAQSALDTESYFEFRKGWCTRAEAAGFECNAFGPMSLH